jgi:hypothetical protein
MGDYMRRAPCGFCPLFGRDITENDVCADCELQIVRLYLEDLLDIHTFDHDHKYRHDDEDHVRNCAHCEHGLTYDTRYYVNAKDDEVWCELKTPCGEGRSTNKGSDTCEHWVRAVDRAPRKEAACDTQ